MNKKETPDESLYCISFEGDAMYGVSTVGGNGMDGVA